MSFSGVNGEGPSLEIQELIENELSGLFDSQDLYQWSSDEVGDVEWMVGDAILPEEWFGELAQMYPALDLEFWYNCWDDCYKAEGRGHGGIVAWGRWDGTHEEFGLDPEGWELPSGEALDAFGNLDVEFTWDGPPVVSLPDRLIQELREAETEEQLARATSALRTAGASELITATLLAGHAPRIGVTELELIRQHPGALLRLERRDGRRLTPQAQELLAVK